MVEEDKNFSIDYLDPNKRSIANAIQIYFNDGTMTDKITVEYPIGHKRRREEGIPLLHKKFEENISTHYKKEKINELISLFSNQETLEKMPVNLFMDKW